MRAEPGRPPAAAARRSSDRRERELYEGHSGASYTAVWLSICCLLSKSELQYSFFIFIIQKRKMGVRPQLFSCSALWYA